MKIFQTPLLNEMFLLRFRHSHHFRTLSYNIETETEYLQQIARREEKECQKSLFDVILMWLVTYNFFSKQLTSALRNACSMFADRNVCTWDQPGHVDELASVWNACSWKLRSRPEKNKRSLLLKLTNITKIFCYGSFETRKTTCIFIEAASRIQQVQQFVLNSH